MHTKQSKSVSSKKTPTNTQTRRHTVFYNHQKTKPYACSLPNKHETTTYLAQNKHINKKNSYFVARINLPQTETADLMLMVMPASKM